MFGCKCFLLNNKDNLGKFESKIDKGIFLGYSLTSKAYRVFNLRTQTFEKSIHVIFNETNSLSEKRKEANLEEDLDKLKIQHDSQPLIEVKECSDD